MHSTFEDDKIVPELALSADGQGEELDPLASVSCYCV